MILKDIKVINVGNIALLFLGVVLLFSFGCFEPKQPPSVKNNSIVVVNITSTGGTSSTNSSGGGFENGNGGFNGSVVDHYTKGPVSIEFLSLCNSEDPDNNVPGDAVLISGNDKIILIDTGSSKTYHQLNSILRNYEPIHVDYLILTSTIGDRIGGLKQLISEYPHFTDNIVYAENGQFDTYLDSNINLDTSSINIQKLPINQNLCVNGICFRYIYGPTQGGSLLASINVYGHSVLLGPDLTPQDISDVVTKNPGNADVLEIPSFGHVTYLNSKAMQKYITEFEPKQLVATGCAKPINQRHFLDKYISANFDNITFYKSYEYNSNVVVFVNPDGKYSVVYRNE